MEIITICGSLKFKDKMMEEAQRLSYEGYCVLTPVYPVLNWLKPDNDTLMKLKEAHFKRIELSNKIYVLNVDGYIGESTALEIDYAKKINKEILYYES